MTSTLRFAPVFFVILTACGEPGGLVAAATGSSQTGSGGNSQSGSGGSSGNTGGGDTGGSPGTGGGRLLFFDDFEYAVDRSDGNAVSAFQAAGWTGAKTEQAQEPNANGWLYTTTAVPGSSAALPGMGSSRVLVMEARPFSDGGQTDFYLQLGNASSSEFDDYIPGDVWFQFWMYPQDDGAEQSLYHNRNKFFYVCNDFYPCHSHLWMVGQSAATYDPDDMFPFGYPTDGQFFWNLSSAAGASTLIKRGDPDNADQIGPTTVAEWMRPNRWTLVKMHFNTTATTGNSWEVWLRGQGEPWVKVSEWIGGTTPGFTWDIPTDAVGGHRELRMPTTAGTSDYESDYWNYMDDFAMATSEHALPTYSD